MAVEQNDSLIDIDDGLDDIFSKLLELHQQLDESEASRFNSCLIMLLANHVNDENKMEQFFQEALKYAKDQSPAPHYNA